MFFIDTELAPMPLYQRQTMFICIFIGMKDTALLSVREVLSLYYNASQNLPDIVQYAGFKSQCSYTRKWLIIQLHMH